MAESAAELPKPSPKGTDSLLLVPTNLTSRRLVSLQVLRGIAALMVVVHHSIHQSPGFLTVWPTEAGQAGVDLFFVISGFVMVYVTNKRERSTKQFLAMRAARIVPVYWFFTLASAALMFVAPKLYNSNELTFNHLVLSLFFIPHVTATSGWSPLVKQGWTLNYEVFFYVLFAIAMAISVRHRTAISLATLAAFTVAGELMRATGFHLGVFGFYFQPIILEFGFGILIAVLFLRGKQDWIKAPLAATMILAGILAIFVLNPGEDLSHRAFIYGLPAAAIVIGSLFFEHHLPFRLGFLQWVGDASYSIYLVHIFPIAVLRKIWPLPMEGAASLGLFLLTTITVVALLGRLSYIYVEQRSLQFLRRLIESRLG